MVAELDRIPLVTVCRQPIDVFARLGDAVTVDGKVILTPTLPKPPPEEAEGGKPSS